MKIDLCKIFGVEEGEEFEIEFILGKSDLKYKIIDNQLHYLNEVETLYIYSTYLLNDLARIKNIIKLPKRKEFTDDELAIMRSLPKKYEYITRDRTGHIYLYTKKPTKFENEWTISCCRDFTIFNTLFNSIKWEDEEPVFIDDYVER